MFVAQVSPNSVLANPSQVNPLAQTNNHTTTTQTNQAAQLSVSKSKTDTVTISPQAAQMSAKAGSLTDELREPTAKKTAENAKGQK